MSAGRWVMRTILDLLSAGGGKADPCRAVYRGEFTDPLVQRIDGGFVITFLCDADDGYARFVMPDDSAYRLADQIADGLTHADGGIHD